MQSAQAAIFRRYEPTLNRHRAPVRRQLGSPEVFGRGYDRRCAAAFLDPHAGRGPPGSTRPVTPRAA